MTDIPKIIDEITTADRKALPKTTEDFNSMIKIVFYNSLGLFYITFLVPYIANETLTATGFQIGFLASVQIFGYMFSSLFVGILTDNSKFSKTKLILVGSWGRGISYFIIYIATLAQSLTLLSVGTFSLGFGVGFFWIPFDTLISEKSNRENRSYAFGKRDQEMGKGVMIGSFIGFTLFGFGTGLNWPVFLLFSPMILFGLGNMYAGTQFVRNVDESIKFRKDNLNSDSFTEELFQKNGNSQSKFLILGFVFLLIVLFLASLNGSIAQPFIQIYILDNISNNPNALLFAYLPGGIISFTLAPKIGSFVDRFNPALAITISSVFGAITTYFFLNTDSLVMIAILWTLDTTIASVAGLSVQNLLSRISINNRGKIFGLQKLFINIGNIAGPLFGGLAWDKIDPTAPFLISIYVELCLIPFYWIAVTFILPHLAEKTKKELHNDKIEKTNEKS
ncbi:MFS transporter [Promethearchaeum syntrophicum]|uniref:MFS transporter n=1 Tax=Promethearchaeum syntrophicum TaxID=2594042 RepID=A0A5B9DG57_9ARCH|nr:MFS transporter [Candidatus Prometheoarchaeum syntrophicum]QEE18035.1 Major Facilitator Superfamily protein [Candidatus Prometheoarchaeum syntrophicum]